MSMAQDTSLRTLRTDDTYSRDPAPTNGGKNDPLAELARLIGQNDPFADHKGQDPRAVRPPAQPAAPDWLARTPARPAEPAYEDQYPAQHDAYQHDPRYDAHAYDNAQGAYAQDGQDNAAYGYDNAYYDDGQLPPEGEEGYDEAPPAKRRGGLRTVAALVALAIVGTGGALGYRSWSSSSATDGEPPVIKAEQGPAKIVPAATSDNQINKQIYDRVGDRGGEKVVTREEQPVDVRAAATRSIAAPPGAMGVSGATGSVLPPVAAPTTSPGSAAGEPKKVKTVAIRPDQPTAAPATIPAARNPAATQTAPVSAAPQPTRVATVPVQSTPSRPIGAESGSYVVQVASQKSEADAQASFKALQQKYPSVLGGQQASIRRADLGEKGVFYRAQVGPFTSAEQAAEMCSNLKSAGGQCIVQRN
jgi:cell division protein FtsN